MSYFRFGFRLLNNEVIAFNFGLFTFHLLSNFVAQRSKPSSRDFLIGEQPNPWDLLQPQDKSSRHRGAEPCRRFGRLGTTSLLSPG